MQKLYKWLDANAVMITKLLLRKDYHKIHDLSKRKATFANFINHIETIARKPEVRALDVIIVLHGQRDKLHFSDGNVSSSTIKKKLEAEDLSHRLRLLYSTACYGATHAQDFVDAGFRTASGAEGICANGPYDLPAQLYCWKENNTYKSVVKAGNNEIALKSHDLFAKGLGFRNVNSHKIVMGKKFTRITSLAN